MVLSPKEQDRQEDTCSNVGDVGDVGDVDTDNVADPDFDDEMSPKFKGYQKFVGVNL
ncbi:MAG: hypothetical protein IPM69_01180 [Ignavibacteria bacterium]|nr:hypothetical protein [Ignavibacteria bacterium]